MSTMHNPIVRIGSLYYIPIEASDQLIDLNDFSNGEDTRYDDGAQIVDCSTSSDRYATSHQAYVVVQILPFLNGEEQTLDGYVDRELRRVYEYLYGKGLVPNAVFNGVVSSDPFSQVLQSL